MNSEDEEEEKKDYSNSSEGEMVIYLDPEDYQKEAAMRRK